MRPALNHDPDLTDWVGPNMLILTGILTVAALVYLTYAMIRPESF
ncbi:potassium-transporting ATPase subunit F [Singulisphaera sp. PoT]